MNECRQKRIQKTERSHSHSNAVHQQRAGEILQDDAAAASGNAQSLDKSGEITSDENYIRTFPCDVGSRAHGDSDIGLNQRWSIIDPISHHGDFAIFPAQFPDPCGFLVWLEVSHGLVHAESATHGGSGGLRIPTQKDNFESHSVASL